MNRWSRQLGLCISYAKYVMPFMFLKERERGKGMNETKRRSVAPSTALKKFHDEEESLRGRNS